MAQPVRKTRLEADFHAAHRHIQQMGGAARAIRHAATQPPVSFHDDDAPARALEVQFEPEDGAAETPADDDDCLADLDGCPGCGIAVDRRQILFCD